MSSIREVLFPTSTRPLASSFFRITRWWCSCIYFLEEGPLCCTTLPFRLLQGFLPVVPVVHKFFMLGFDALEGVETPPKRAAGMTLPCAQNAHDNTLLPHSLVFADISVHMYEYFRVCLPRRFLSSYFLRPAEQGNQPRFQLVGARLYCIVSPWHSNSYLPTSVIRMSDECTQSPRGGRHVC